MRLAIAAVLLAVAISMTDAAPHHHRAAKVQDDDDDMAKIERLLAKLQDDDDDDVDMESFWSKFGKGALKHGLKYASGLFAEQQDDDDNLAEIEDLFAELQDDDDDDVDMESFWSKLGKGALKHGLKYASGFFAEQQNENENDNDGGGNNNNGNENNGLVKIERILAKLQDDDDDDVDMESFWSKLGKGALKHGLKYASGFFAEQQNENENDNDGGGNNNNGNENNGLAKIERILAKLQDDDDDDVTMESFLSTLGKAALGGLFAKQQDNENENENENENDGGGNNNNRLAKMERMLAKLQDDDDDDVDMESFWSKFGKGALKHGLKYASGLFAEQQNDDDKLAEIEDLFAELEGDDYNAPDEEMADLQSFWKKALHRGLKYASGFFAKQQDGHQKKKMSLARKLLEKLAAAK